MFFQFTRFFRGYLKVCICGRAPERLLNLCSHHDMLIWDLKSCGESYEFYISLPAFRQIRPLLRKTKTRIHILKKCGLPFFLYQYRSRKMFFAGIAICLTLLYISTGYLWCIELNGNTVHADQTLLRYLKSIGCSCGVRMSKVDCDKIEEQLRITYTDIIWVSARIEGTKLFLDVKENLAAGEKKAAQKLTEQEAETGYDIIASKKGKVTRIVTRSGTPKVKAGDTVKKGEILVSGALPIYNDNDEIDHYDKTVADADIYLMCAYRYEDTIPFQQPQKKYTGKTAWDFRLKIASMEWHVPFWPCDRSDYEGTAQTKQVCLLKNLYFPIWVQSTHLRQYHMERIEYSEKELRQQEEEKFKEFFKKLHKKEVEILEKNVIIDIVGDSLRASGTIRVVEKTGIYQKTQEIKENERQITDEFNGNNT